MTDNATTKPEQVELFKINMLTMKPAAARLVRRPRLVRIVILDMTPSKRREPRMWA